MRRIAAIALAAGLMLTCAAGADAFVYWANRDNASIGRAKSNGKGVDQDYIDTRSSVYGVAVDSDHVYWSDRKKGRIGRADRDGTEIDRDFITGLSSPHGIAVNSDYVYWVDTGANRIGRAALDGSGVNPDFIVPLKGAGDVAVDDQHVYWTNSTGLGRANLDGTGVDPGFVATQAYGVALDAEHIFWAYFGYSPTRGGVGRANLSGSGVKQKFIAVKGLYAQDVAVDDAHVWWIEQTGGLGRAALSGKHVKAHFIKGPRVGHGDNGLADLAVDADGTPPLTSIRKGPPDRTRSSTARFVLASSEPHSKLVCKLDKHGWKHCGASYELKHLDPGEHKLLVRATDEFGNTDPTPAKAKWVVK
jgi:virginiamycin B lyase